MGHKQVTTLNPTRGRRRAAAARVLKARSRAIGAVAWGSTQTGRISAPLGQRALAEALGQSVNVHQEGLFARRRFEPSSTIGSEATGGHEQVDVWMPLERAGPGVEHGESTDTTAEPAWIGAERGERIEHSVEGTPRSAR
jgi:hypothetical protein